MGHARLLRRQLATKNDIPFNDYGKISKQQYNAKIYQPIGSNGDFISLAGHYNENRNNFFGSLPLRTDTTQSATDSAPRNRRAELAPTAIPTNRDERFYKINFPCTTDTPQAGVADTVAGASVRRAACGTEFDRRYNPSNTGNIRGKSRFTLADGLILTVDPSYQYVKANGGGTVNAEEGACATSTRPAARRDCSGTGNCLTTADQRDQHLHRRLLRRQRLFAGRDLNGDGDMLDQVTVLAPSQTHTDRYGVIAGLRWDFAHGPDVRVGYTLDDAHHRQTGEVGFLQANGEPIDVFPHQRSDQGRRRLRLCRSATASRSRSSTSSGANIAATLRQPDGQRRPARALLHPQPEQLSASPRAPRASSSAPAGSGARCADRAAQPYSFDPTTGECHRAGRRRRSAASSTTSCCRTSA